MTERDRERLRNLGSGKSITKAYSTSTSLKVTGEPSVTLVEVGWDIVASATEHACPFFWGHRGNVRVLIQ